MKYAVDVRPSTQRRCLLDGDRVLDLGTPFELITLIALFELGGVGEGFRMFVIGSAPCEGAASSGGSEAVTNGRTPDGHPRRKILRNVVRPRRPRTSDTQSGPTNRP
jgi:hypothetical protein